MGHLRNQLMVLWKLQKWSVNNPSTHPVLINVNVAQTFLLSSLLAGKLWEGWQLLRVAYFASKVSKSIEEHLPEKAQLGLANLKKYFKANNLIDDIRNQFAFHYDPEKVQAQLQQVEDGDEMFVCVAEKSANMFYHVSEVIVASAMLESVVPGDFNQATRKFYEEIGEVSRYFIDFCDGCLEYMTDEYLGTTKEELNATELIIADPPHRDEIELPFFSR